MAKGRKRGYDQGLGSRGTLAVLVTQQIQGSILDGNPPAPDIPKFVQMMKTEETEEKTKGGGRKVINHCSKAERQKDTAGRRERRREGEREREERNRDR